MIDKYNSYQLRKISTLSNEQLEYEIRYYVNDFETPMVFKQETIKAVKLMTYLCKMITPPNGIIIVHS